MNPWTLSLTIRDLRLTEPDGARFASWEEFYLNFQASSLLRWAWTFKEIRLVKPFGAITLQKDGRLNFANMFPEPSAALSEPEPTARTVPRLRVFALTITNGFLALEDQTRRTPFRTEYRPINLQLTRLTTRPDTATPYSFRAENDSGQSLTWTGDIIVEPFSSHGSIGIVGAEPMRYQPYLEDFTTAQIIAGKADLLANYWFSTGTNGIDLTVSNASLRSVGFEIRNPAAQESVLNVPLFAVENAWLDLRTRAAGAERATVEKAQVLTRRERDGSINLLNLLVRGTTNEPANTTASQESSAPAPAAGEPWTLNVDTFAVREASVKFQDLSGVSTFETHLDPIEFTLEKFTTAPEKDARFRFSIETEAREQFGGSGSVSINPVRSAGEIKLASIQLRKYWPYMEPFLSGGVQDGQVESTVPYQMDLGTNGLQAAVSNVLLRVSNFKVHGPDSDETLLAMSAFAIENAQANLAERFAKVAAVKVQGGSLLARRNPDGKVNLLSLLKTSASRPAVAPGANSHGTGESESMKKDETPAQSAPWTARVDEIDLSGYSISFEDLSLSNTARVRLDELALNAKGVTTQSNQPVTLRFSTRFNQTGNLALHGEVCALPPRAEVEVGMTNVDLCALQPYLDEHVNLTLNKGFFSLHGKARWQTDGTNPPPTRFAGGLEVTQFQATDEATFQEFVRWGALCIGGIDFSLQPNQLKVTEVSWDGLKTSLLIDTNKQVNLLAIMPAKTNASAPQAALSEAARKENAEAPKPSEPVATARQVSFPVSVDRFILTNASFHFGDASIQPPCRFDIQRFSGTIDGLSSDPASTATVNLRGHIDEQAPFAVVGRVNPLSPVLKVDVSISNSNIQLPAFTPYMEKFAGHPLNRGRLSLDLR